MAKAKSDLNIDIPNDCYVVKAWFFSRPDDGRIRTWKQEIGRNGNPHLVWGHTHTKPAPGSKPIYLDTFDLPEKHRRLGHLAPCPCCWPRHRKYGLDGKIAWFPDEGVVRMLGPDCFASLDPEGHAIASAELIQRRKRERDIAFLLKNKDRHIRAKASLGASRKVATAINLFSKKAKKILNETLDLPLWDQVKRGQLSYTASENELNPKTGEVRTIDVDRLHANIAGFMMLKPDLKDFELHIDNCILGLDQVKDDGSWHTYIAGLSDKDREVIAKIISGAVKKGKGLIQEMRDIQKFVSPLTINTLRTWGKLDGCRLPMTIYRNGDNIFFARSALTAQLRLSIPPHLEDELLDIDAPTLDDPVIVDR